MLTRFPHTQFFIDLKSPDVAALEYVEKVAQVIKQTHAGNRVRVYSTSEAYTDAAESYSLLNVFKSRAETRDILFSSKLSNQCKVKSYMLGWHAFELTDLI